MGNKSIRNGKNYRINKIGFLFGLISLAIFIGVRLFGNDPYEMIHKFDSSGVIPPLWLLNLLSFVWGFLIGYGAGLVFDRILCGGESITSEISAYRGGLFFLVSFFLSQMWYSVFFDGEHLVLAILLIVIALVSSIVCAFFWYSVLKLSSLILGAYGLWQFYLFILNASVILYI